MTLRQTEQAVGGTTTATLWASSGRSLIPCLKEPGVCATAREGGEPRPGYEVGSPAVGSSTTAALSTIVHPPSSNTISPPTIVWGTSEGPDE